MTLGYRGKGGSVPLPVDSSRSFALHFKAVMVASGVASYIITERNVWCQKVTEQASQKTMMLNNLQKYYVNA